MNIREMEMEIKQLEEQIVIMKKTRYALIAPIVEQLEMLMNGERIWVLRNNMKLEIQEDRILVGGMDITETPEHMFQSYLRNIQETIDMGPDPAHYRMVEQKLEETQSLYKRLKNVQE